MFGLIELFSNDALNVLKFIAGFLALPHFYLYLAAEAHKVASKKSGEKCCQDDNRTLLVFDTKILLIIAVAMVGIFVFLLGDLASLSTRFDDQTTLYGSIAMTDRQVVKGVLNLFGIGLAIGTGYYLHATFVQIVRDVGVDRSNLRE